MADNSGLAWGVDFDAPAPRRKPGWGTDRHDVAPPARRSPAHTPFPAEPDPQTAQAPAAGEPMPGEPAGGQSADPFAAFDVAPHRHTPVPSAELTPEAPREAGHVSEWAPTPASDAGAGFDALWADPTDTDSELSSGSTGDAAPAAPAAESGWSPPQPAHEPSAATTPEPAARWQDAPAAAPVAASDLEPDEAVPAATVDMNEASADGSGGGHLEVWLPPVAAPDVYAPTVEPAGTVDHRDAPGSEVDLASMFDDAPAPAAEVAPYDEATASAAPPAEIHGDGVDFDARRTALAAARATTQDRVFAAGISEDAQRYIRQDEYYLMVRSVLDQGMAMGDPRTQGVVASLELTRDPDLDALQRRRYQEAITPRLAAAGIQVPPGDVKAVFDMAYDELLGIGPLGPLWRDDSVTEIIVSGPDKVTVERDGHLMRTPVRFRDLAHLEETARRLSAKYDDRTVNRTNPLVTAQLPRARVQFVWKPLAVNGVSVTIRKFQRLLGMGELLAYGSLSNEMAAFLCDAVMARATVLVSGGTGSGKTTMINAVSSFIPDTERVVTIEDARELDLANTHVEPLLTKEAASGDDEVIVGQDDLLRAALRMRPDRIIIGEIRDPRGCAVMLEAANTGHEGTMTTVHANTPEAALRRLSKLLRKAEPQPAELAREEVMEAFDVIVQVVRKRGRRYISAITAVLTDEHGEHVATPLFAGDFPSTAQAPRFRRVGSIGADTDLAQRMNDAGIDPGEWQTR